MFCIRRIKIEIAENYQTRTNNNHCPQYFLDDKKIRSNWKYSSWIQLLMFYIIDQIIILRRDWTGDLFESYDVLVSVYVWNSCVVGLRNSTKFFLTFRISFILFNVSMKSIYFILCCYIDLCRLHIQTFGSLIHYTKIVSWKLGLLIKWILSFLVNMFNLKFL